MAPVGGGKKKNQQKINTAPKWFIIGSSREKWDPKKKKKKKEIERTKKKARLGQLPGKGDVRGDTQKPARERMVLESVIAWGKRGISGMHFLRHRYTWKVSSETRGEASGSIKKGGKFNGKESWLG